MQWVSKMKKAKILLALLLCFVMLYGCADNAESGNSPESALSSVENEESESSVAVSEDSTEAAVNPLNTDRCFYGNDSGTKKTYTGFEPLELADFSYGDSYAPENFSTEMISHSYGYAKDEKPHTISVDYQKLFDEKNYDAVCLDDKTEEKVLYLTFDCGYENGYTSKILDTLKEKEVSAAFFCTLPQMRDNPDIIARMIKEGHIVGNHSVTHPDFSTLSEAQIIEELKGFDDYIRENFGYSSLYFRNPQGKYSERSMRAVNELGFKAVFWSLAYADWDLENQKGAMYAFETVMERIHPGAVILLHAVSPDNANALADIIDASRERGYEFRSLEDM